MRRGSTAPEPQTITTSDLAARTSDQSQNLMNVVAVVYGAGLTLALTARDGAVLLNPTSSAHGFASLALLDATLLGAYAFFSYSLSVGGSKPYLITWVDGGGSKGKEAFRFCTDLALAVLYVRLFLRATTVSDSGGAAPNLEHYFVAYIAVFLGAAAVRWYRYGHFVVGAQLTAAVAVTACALIAGHRSPTATLDWLLEGVLFVGVSGYAVINHRLSYRSATARGEVPRVAVGPPSAGDDGLIEAPTPER